MRITLPSMRRRRCWSCMVLMFAAALPMHAHEVPAMHVMQDVRFDRPAPLARPETLLARVMTPLAFERLRAQAAAQSLRGDSLDIGRQRFALYVPTAPAPADGYALLVFVPPWDEAGIPSGWLPVLARHGVILVTAAQSGNDADVITQRIPLALAGHVNVAARYRLNPARVYVGGFSGGARVAQRIALAYPELFRGALLNAGSDAFGDGGVALPQSAVWRDVENRGRFVYATGSRDESALASDRRSRASARDLCLRDLVTLPMRGRGHAPIEAATLEHALAALDAPHQVAPDGEACRAQRAARIKRQLADVARRIDAGDLRGAARRLDAVDARFGGLALPLSMQLARRLAERAPASGP